MTMQIKDRLIYDSEEYSLSEYLLERYFSEFPEKRNFKKIFFTALWRGYVAVYEITGTELFVKEVRLPSGMGKEGIDFSMIQDDLFPGNKKMDWFSGLIRIDENRLTDKYDNRDGFFEFLVIKDGNLINRLKLDYQEFVLFRNTQFENFKKTGYYKKVFSSRKISEPHLSDEKIDTWIFELIIRYIREIT